MPKFRKKPVAIEAFQMTKARRQDNSEWPAWMHAAWNENHHATGALYPANYPASDGTDKLIVHTLEGHMTVEWNDWIIRGVNGELYSCKPDIFEKTYEAVDE